MVDEFTEERLEIAIIEDLTSWGYAPFAGDQITRDPLEVLIKKDPATYLMAGYTKDSITIGEVNSIIRKLQSILASDLYESNKTIMIQEFLDIHGYPAIDNDVCKDILVQADNYKKFRGDFFE